MKNHGKQLVEFNTLVKKLITILKINQLVRPLVLNKKDKKCLYRSRKIKRK